MARSPRAARTMRFSGRGFRAGSIPKVKPAAKIRRSRKGGRTPPAGYRVVTVGNKTRYVRARQRSKTTTKKTTSARTPTMNVQRMPVRGR